MSNRNYGTRLWQTVDEFIPTLDEREQNLIYDEMRGNAIADVDFYLLISLASGIAYFGLQQSSSVVIIGAMLVAPLMSPMMAMGFGIVNGNLPLFWRGAISTLSGMGLAIGISALITYLFPLKTVTEEILARTNPNILDLFVALISGMAGAYALGRKEVSASLPGVAIAASLVPPLCVVGFGLGSFNFGIATRALILFTTNLGSIVLSGILVFWLLGFRPDPSTGTHLFRRTVQFAMLGVFLVAIPLVIYTVQGSIETSRAAEVQTILQTIDPAIAEIEDIVIQSVDDGFVIGATVYLYTEALGSEDQQAAVEEIRRQLESAVGRPVTMRARVVSATLNIIERPGLDVEALDP